MPRDSAGLGGTRDAVFPASGEACWGYHRPKNHTLELGEPGGRNTNAIGAMRARLRGIIGGNREEGENPREVAKKDTIQDLTTNNP